MRAEPGRVSFSRTTLVLGAFSLGLAGAVVGGVIAATSTLLLRADAKAISKSLAARVGQGDLNLRAKRNFNVTANHVRVVGRDGNFEFEHSTTSPLTRLNAYFLGTGTRTPVAIGDTGDANDIVPLLVQGIAAQKRDLQQWQVDGKTVAAIDAAGHLRLGGITLWTQVIDGVPSLFVQSPGTTPKRVSLR